MKRAKEIKSLELFKKGFRKNEIVIYAIALMLVTAGYFNYSANTEKALETASENIVENKTENTNNAKKENETENTNNAKKEETENTDNAESKKNDTALAASKETEKEDDDIGDAKLVNSDNVVKEEKETEDSSDYYISTKLQRDTNFADMISTYTKILEDSSVAETQKAIAMKEIKKITDIKNAISVCENILSTKGFKNYVVLVNNDSVNVVVKTDGDLSKSKVAQIHNIVSRELNCKIENIHITTK